MISDIFKLQNPWQFNSDFKFNFFPRKIFSELEKNLDNEKILWIIWSRQVWKSSLIFLLIENLIKKWVKKENIFYFNLDNFLLHSLFWDTSEFLDFLWDLSEKKYIFIDEVQRLKNPWIFLKEIYDLKLNLKIVYSWSSQLEIKSKVKENLVWRVRQFEIQRLSFEEFLNFKKPITKSEAFENILNFWSYPDVVKQKSKNDKILAIRDIYQTYIQKDLVKFLQIENIEAFNKLLVLLANQIWSLLNIDHLSNTLKISRDLTKKYISILENTFVIKLVYPFFKNYKKEITKTPKIFFLDLWLRNFILNNFQEIDLRNDKWELFENFYFLELLNKDFYWLNKINYWRTTNQTEIDFILQKDWNIFALETKFSSEKNVKSFLTIEKFYPEMKNFLVNKKNFLEINEKI